MIVRQKSISESGTIPGGGVIKPLPLFGTKNIDKVSIDDQMLDLKNSSNWINGNRFGLLDQSDKDVDMDVDQSPSWQSVASGNKRGRNELSNNSSSDDAKSQKIDNMDKKSKKK